MAALTTTPIRVATRRSQLATTQAQTVADALSEYTGRPSQLVLVTTDGDVATGSLASLGGVGVFVGAVRDAVFDGEADVCVHSLKDLPTAAHPDFEVVAIPVREDPRDALCADEGMTLDQLPEAAVVGTGSPRRASQLRALRPDLDVVDIRGNVDTRLAKVADGECDAVILAAAGLSRLDRVDAITQRLDPIFMLPAPGQGALAVEAAVGLADRDPDLHKALLLLNDSATRAAVEAERALLNSLEAGCTAPVGALATVTARPSSDPHSSDSSLHNTHNLNLHAMAAAVDGSQVIRMSIAGDIGDAEQLGRDLASQLLAAGAADLLGESAK